MSLRTLSLVSFRHARTTGFCFLITAFVIGASLKTSAWIWPAPVSKIEPRALESKTEVTSTSLPQGITAKESIEAEVITIRPAGFEPTEITRPKGRFLLAINNRSRLEQVALHLFTESGGREREMRVQRNKPDWRRIVDLQPGRYALREANHPDWVCHITITNR